MRILMCVGAAPLPPLDGFGLLVDALVRQFQAAGHEVVVLANRAPGREAADEVPEWLRLVPLQRRGALAKAMAVPAQTLRGRPLSAVRKAESMRAPLAAALTAFRPDVVHVSSGRMAGLWPQLAGRPTVLAALDAHHVNVAAKMRAAPPWRRLPLAAEVWAYQRFVKATYRRFGGVVTVTAEDRDALLALDPSLAITVIANGVDADRFAPDAAAPRSASRLLFTGVMRYPPNMDAAEYLAHRILPAVRARRPDAELAIVGHEPAPAVRALADLPGVAVTGGVPRLEPWLAGSRVYVCPMRTGTGIKNKLLEAMACGAPCVATPLAAQGLDAVPGRDLLIAEGEAAFADAVVAVLADDGLARRLGEAARACVLERHSWKAAASAYLDCYQAVIAASDPLAGGAVSAEREPPSRRDQDVSAERGSHPGGIRT